MSTPDETLLIVKSLPYLDDVSLVCAGPIVDRCSSDPCRLSFSPMVLSGINPLKRFTIYTFDSYNKSDSKSIPMIPMFKALENHIQTLKEVQITLLDAPTSKRLLFEILKFISSSQVEILFFKAKIWNRPRNIDFVSFMPRVPGTRLIKICEATAPNSLREEKCRALTMRWRTVPKHESEDVELDNGLYIHQSGSAVEPKASSEAEDPVD